jgi:hypothetical protein
MKMLLRANGDLRRSGWKIEQHCTPPDRCGRTSLQKKSTTGCSRTPESDRIPKDLTGSGNGSSQNK